MRPGFLPGHACADPRSTGEITASCGEVAHETNTFRSGVTELNAFQSRDWSEGAGLIAKHRGVRNDLGGMIEAGERLGFELVPTLATTIQPSTMVSRHAYETIRHTSFAHFAAAGKLDAICLALHGGGSVDGSDDLESAFLTELRDRVGTTVPIVVALDLHGNTTEEMVKHATALCYCHEYPHIDAFERGAEIIGVAAKVVRREVRPLKHLVRLPVAIPPSTTFSGPAMTINERCFLRESTPGVLDCAFTQGFPHTNSG